MLNKREFLDRLRNELMDLTVEERKEALEYYEEYFADAGEENEADVLRTLGSPEQVAAQIKAGLWKAEEGMFTGNGHQGQQTEKKKSGMSGGIIALLIVLGILASPLILGIGGAFLGIVLGVLGGILGIVIAGLAMLVALFAAGFALFVAGVPMLFVNPIGGILCIAAGCFIIAAFLALFLLIWLLFGKFFPWLIREVESFGKYLSRKWTERKQKGETI